MLIYTLKLSIFVLLGFYCLKLSELTSAIEYYCLTLTKLLASVAHIFDSAVQTNESIIYRYDYSNAVDVDSGCSGLDFVIIISAAILAYPVSLKKRLLILWPAIIFTIIVNGVRIISLLYIQLWWGMSKFAFAHEKIWPFIFAASINIFFFQWLADFRSETLEK